MIDEPSFITHQENFTYLYIKASITTMSIIHSIPPITPPIIPPEMNQHTPIIVMY